MNRVSSERANMEKRKRKPKDGKFPIEFISPFSLEECVSRIPSELVVKVSPHDYEFHLKSNINDKRNQFTNISGYLRRNNETSTSVQGKISTNPFIYLFLGLVIPLFTFILVVMSNYLLVALVFLPIVLIFSIYITFGEQKRVAEGIFNAFKPIPKTKKQPKKGFEAWFPRLSLQVNSDLSLNSCGVRLQELAFSFTTCKIIALDEKTYAFSVSGLAGYWGGVRATGVIYTEGYSTIIQGWVGIRPVTYLGILVMTGIFTLPFLGNSGPRMLLTPDLLIIPLFVLGACLFSVSSLRKGIEKILQP